MNKNKKKNIESCMTVIIPLRRISFFFCFLLKEMIQYNFIKVIFWLAKKSINLLKKEKNRKKKQFFFNKKKKNTFSAQLFAAVITVIITVVIVLFVAAKELNRIPLGLLLCKQLL